MAVAFQLKMYLYIACQVVQGADHWPGRYCYSSDKILIQLCFHIVKFVELLTCRRKYSLTWYLYWWWLFSYIRITVFGGRNSLALLVGACRKCPFYFGAGQTYHIIVRYASHNFGYWWWPIWRVIQISVRLYRPVNWSTSRGVVVEDRPIVDVKRVGIHLMILFPAVYV